TFAIADLGHIPNPEELTCNQFYYFEQKAQEFSRAEFLKELGKDYYDFFYESWAQGATLLVRAEHARNVIRCIELMTESAKSNCTVMASNMLPTGRDGK
ncbi:MAG: hypothetical protein WCT05_10495, partial [Lentisphaeria bacterium]